MRYPGEFAREPRQDGPLQKGESGGRDGSHPPVPLASLSPVDDASEDVPVVIVCPTVGSPLHDQGPVHRNLQRGLRDRASPGGSWGGHASPRCTIDSWHQGCTTLHRSSPPELLSLPCSPQRRDSKMGSGRSARPIVRGTRCYVPGAG
jgi:hypothetical protein